MNIGLYDTLQKGDFTSEVTVLKAIASCTR
ncbi:hypothetical protein LGAA44_330127 [Leuconostoc gasicomitatum]|nr:hypothetical protein LGAA44_330127 [Leuconostoc gasicomitatum]